MKNIYILAVVFATLIPHLLQAQAGLGLRHLDYKTPVNGMVMYDSTYQVERFSFGLHYRWFDAAVPYSGNLRQEALEMENLHEIFNMHAGNISFGYHYNKRWSAHLTAPLVFNQKSSVLEHSLVNGSFVARQRRVTESAGLGDVFLMINYAAVLPTAIRRARLDVGIGVKAPTGDYRAQDTWHNVGPNRTPVLRPVDPVIQPGDGTWGAIVDLSGSYTIADWVGVYAEGRYLSTPASTNGTRTFRSTFSDEFSEEDIVSVSDQYMIRGGVSLTVPRSAVAFSFGIRVDGTPVNDLIGTSEGFRRPGYATSFESSIIIKSPQFDFFFSLPYIYYQQREQSNADKLYGQRTGQFAQGDAAFARFALFVGVQSKF